MLSPYSPVSTELHVFIIEKNRRRKKFFDLLVGRRVIKAVTAGLDSVPEPEVYTPSNDVKIRLGLMGYDSIRLGNVKYVSEEYTFIFTSELRRHVDD